jgi:hypothetical protein
MQYPAIENTDGKDDDGDGDAGAGAGVLRAFGADADGIWNREKKMERAMMKMVMEVRGDVMRMGEGSEPVQSRK